MCGIAGLLERSKVVDKATLNTLARLLLHRGPDGQKIWLSEDERCGFVHTRLAILDTGARSDQPFVSDDGRYTMVFNGEIFNFLELREELRSSGVVFRTDGDAEVLLNCYAVWGADMLLRLNGMWALVIHDNRDGSIFLARDRFGIKPLLYSQLDGRFAFASEVGALLAVPWVDREPALEVAERLLFDPFGVEASEATLHRGIHRLPGGHCANLLNGKLEVRRWWITAEHLPDRTHGSLEEAASRFRDLFLDSTKLRMRSDVAIGSCLSGGFDSTAVISAMAHIAARDGEHIRVNDDWRHAFVATFPGHGHDESSEAMEAAAHAEVIPHFLNLGSDDGVTLVETVLDALDDVYISLPSAPWLIYQKVRATDVRVTLDGHGADELMGGYRAGGRDLAFRARNLVGGRAGSFAHSWVGDMAKFAMLQADRSYFLRRHRLAPPKRLPIAAYLDQLPEHYTGLDRRLYTMFHASVLPTILRNFDRLSMAHGVEIRMPFMDWRLVTSVMALAADKKSDSTHSKLVARAAMNGIMPDSIRLGTRKVGFNSQMPAWMNGSLGMWAEGTLATSNDAFDEIVDRKKLSSRISTLTHEKRWDWASVGRLWPYINLKWYLDKRCT